MNDLYVAGGEEMVIGYVMFSSAEEMQKAL